MSKSIQKQMTIKESLKLQKTSTKGLNQEEILDLVQQNTEVYTEYFDVNYIKNMDRNVFDYINPTYFRAQFIGFDDFPKRNNPDRPLIFAGNHSGMAFPWDAMVFGAGMLKLLNYDYKRSIRALVAPALSETTLMNPVLLPDFWKRCGGIDATSLNFETMMNRNEANLLIYPEGVPGIGKGFNHRYELQYVSTSMVRMSLKYRTDIIPVLTVNAEWINPFSYKVDWIYKVGQMFGIPFLPLGPMLLLVLIQPWMFYFALPVNLIYVKGRRIKPYELVDKDYEDLTPEEIEQARDHIKTEMQKDLDKAVKEYGDSPYNFKKWLSNISKNLGAYPFYMPIFWPLMLWTQERKFKEANGNPADYKMGMWDMLVTFVKKPWLIIFYIPVIGLVLMIIMGQFNKKKL